MTLAHVRINSGEGWPENRTLGIGTNWEIPKKGIKKSQLFYSLLLYSCLQISSK